MASHPLRFSRRGFLASAAGMSLGGGLTAPTARAAPASASDRTPLAVLGTVHRPLSCLYHLAGRFLHGWPKSDTHHFPAQHVATLWVDQTPDNDLSKDLARDFNFRRTRTIHDAIVTGGNLIAEGVLVAAEHGNYPRNDAGQVLYPRFEIFTQIVAAFHEAGAGVPIYFARQLSHDFDRAKQMVEWSRQLDFPLMAGSVLPYAEHSADLQISDFKSQEVLVAASGPVEVGGFDALEALQCLAERRAGGETGVAAITCLTGRDVWKAGDTGRWSWDLLDAALACSPSANLGDVRTNTGTMAVAGMPATPAIAFLVEYRDGSKGTVLLLNGHVADVTAAAKPQAAGIRAGRFEVHPPPGLRHYDRLAAKVEQFFATGTPSAPIERTLLTTGLAIAGMNSHARRGERIETPELEITYSWNA